MSDKWTEALPEIARFPLKSLHHLGIRSHPDTYVTEGDFDAPMTCRICWGEEDSEDGEAKKRQNTTPPTPFHEFLTMVFFFLGGALLSPCRCAGSSRYVHSRCLKRWIDAVASSKGISFAVRCDVCRSPYRHLPTSYFGPIQEQLIHRLHRFCTEAWEGTSRSALGPAITALATSAWFYSSIHGLFFAISQLTTMPSMLLNARRDPLTALSPLIPRFFTAAIVEPLLSSRDFWFHIETAIFYAFGWSLDAISRWLEDGIFLDGAAAGWPMPVKAVITGALWLPRALGLILQALDLTLMAGYAGGVAGFLHGAFEVAAAPFRACSFAARCGAGVLGVVATVLSRGGYGAAAAARMIQMNRHRP